MLLCESTINQMLLCEWFSHCGEEVSITNLDYIYVEKSTMVSKSYNLSKFENVIYSAQGDMTSFLCVNFRTEFREWNTLVSQIKAEIFPTLIPNVRDKFSNLGLAEELFSIIEYSVLLIIMSSAYKTCYCSSFFDNMKKIYLSGHIPCGWAGEYPSGCFNIH